MPLHMDDQPLARELEMGCKCSVCNRPFDITENVDRWPEILQKEPGIYPVTKSGQLNGQLLGFVCSSCLLSGQKTRSDIKSFLSGVKVSEHAVNQYIKRQPGEPLQLATAATSIIRLFRDAKQIKFRKHSYVARVAPRHSPSLYWYKQGWIFFTTQACPYTIKTMYFGKECDLLLHSEFDFID
jgi:hypothetical protein